MLSIGMPYNRHLPCSAMFDAGWNSTRITVWGVIIAKKCASKSGNTAVRALKSPHKMTSALSGIFQLQIVNITYVCML